MKLEEMGLAQGDNGQKIYKDDYVRYQRKNSSNPNKMDYDYLGYISDLHGSKIVLYVTKIFEGDKKHLNNVVELPYQRGKDWLVAVHGKNESMKLKNLIPESNLLFRDKQRIRNKETGDLGTVTLASPFSVRVMWDDYADAVKNSRSKKISMSYDVDKAKQLFEPALDEYAGINIMPANGQVTMGSKGDASFFGPDAKMKGGVKRSVYKVPKSSIHGEPDERDEDDNVTPAFYDDEEKRAGKKSHVDIGNIPKTSIHNRKFGLKELDVTFPGNGPTGTVGDASFLGKNGMYKGNSRKPIFKTPKSSIYYKKGRFPDESDFHNDDNWETDKPGPSTDVSGRKPYVGNKSVPKNSIHYDEIPDEDRHYISTQEQLGMPVSADGTIDGGPRSMDPIAGKKTKKKKFTEASKYGYPTEEIKMENYNFYKKPKRPINLKASFLSSEEYQRAKKKGGFKESDWKWDEDKNLYANVKNIKNEEKDYDTNIVPKTSIHYGERDAVPGEQKMEFEKVEKAGFVPDDIKNLTPQGDWKSNLTKAVMDLTGEAQPKETAVPVPKVEIGNTPEFPYANETDGSMVYPIPGQGVAIKKAGEWTFGDTPQLPALQQQEAPPSCQGHGEPSDDSEIDIPCTQKPLIKKLMMLIQHEQKNLHEGVALKGIYEGKVVKLNTIFEGDHRRFKAFVKTNEGKVMKVHFGPKPTEECGMEKSKKKIKEDSSTKYVVEPRHDDGSLNVKHYNAKEPKSFITGATENEIFDYFFANNKDNPKFQHSASQKDVTAWYKEQGLTIRKKTW